MRLAHGVVAEDDAQRHQREGDREAEQDRGDEQRQHDQGDWGSVIVPPSATARLLLVLLDDLDLELLDVVQPPRPGAVADAADAAEDLGHALQDEQHGADGISVLNWKIGMPAGLKTLTSR